MEEDVRSLSSFNQEVENVKKQIELKKIEKNKMAGHIQHMELYSKQLLEERVLIEKDQLTFFENERKIDKLNQEYEWLASYEVQQNQHDHTVKNLEKQVKYFEHIKSRYEDSKILVQELEEKWLHGQAAIIAGNLMEGEECPVCGSPHHPKPAHQEKDNIPNEEDLKAAKKQYVDLEAEKGNAESLLLKAETVEKAFADRLVEIMNKIVNFRPDFIENDLDKVKNLILNEQKKLEFKQRNILEKKKKLEKITKEIETLDQELQIWKEQLEKLIKEENELAIEYTKNNTLLQQMMGKIPENLQTVEGFKKELQLSEKNYDELIKRYEQVQQNYQKTNEMLVTERTRIEETGKQKMELERKLQVERDKFTSKMIEQGFTGYSSYHGAKKREEEIEQLQKEVREFREENRSVTDRYEEFSRLLEGVQVPDINGLRDSFEKIKVDLNELQDFYTNLFVRKSEDEQIYNKIKSINENIKSLEGKYQLIGHLYDMARGQNTYRITFERYVLASFLDDILREANHRLAKMTSGRYELLRKTDRSKGNIQSGLELLVFDQYTGQERHVKTLSGGESFKAALSLALGLADIVQQYAGGVSLETMFIDEGFGTLDPESLDQSIEALMDIQSSGRLVGIISHVPELKERIDARLEVNSTQSGSRTEFVFMN